MYVYIYFVKKSEGKKLCNFLAFRERAWNKKSVNKTKVAIHDVFDFFFLHGAEPTRKQIRILFENGISVDFHLLIHS